MRGDWARTAAHTAAGPNTRGFEAGLASSRSVETALDPRLPTCICRHIGVCLSQPAVCGAAERQQRACTAGRGACSQSAICNRLHVGSATAQIKWQVSAPTACRLLTGMCERQRVVLPAANESHVLALQRLDQGGGVHRCQACKATDAAMCHLLS